MADANIPLFPLNLVLFPDAALPLHIFEARYKVLIRECLEGKGKFFGINFVDGAKLSAIGCTAIVREVVQRYDDGRFDIVVEGKRRYQLCSVDDSVAPYPVGRVTFIEDEREVIDPLLVQETVDLYNRLIDVVYTGRLPGLSVDASGVPLSFIMAQKAGMDLQRRQELLEMNSENRRLRMLHTYLAAVIPTLQQAKEIQRIVNSDGYLTH